MAAAGRTFARAMRAGARSAPVKPTARFALPRQAFQQARRGYSSEAPKPEAPAGGNNTLIYGGVAALLLGGGAFYVLNGDAKVAAAKEFVPTAGDFQNVYAAISQKLIDEDDYDDGSYGPVLLRLGWHASGTYDAATGTGGSNGATMRFAPESDHGANAGLKAAREFLEPIKAQYPWISYSDLWTLGAVCAIQEMGGPDVAWRPGRADRDVSYCTPDGRLPDGSQGHDHLRAIFGRMGFSDQEIVALSGAHALGRCHTDRSGFSGPWTFSPTTLTNDYYKLLLDEKWGWKPWDGPKQYEDKKTKTLMMLPTDMSLVQDKSFNTYVKKYAQDQDLFFKDFSAVLVKLFELGVPFQSGEDARITFKRTE